ncbi:MAG TPA: YihY/virulence factor BrkB family protein [Acidimicrobiales bacterium]|nr:YihY/virulence factor BrkB family protein [Acidimicrobiales bacterium]
MAPPRSRTERLDAFQQRHRSAGFVVAVVWKAFDDRAPYLAALVTYYVFISLFPLLLLFISIMGFVLQSHPGLRQSIDNSAVSNLPGIGTLLHQNIQGFKGSGVGIALGLVGLVYGALGATQASQYAFNHIYAVPRCEQPNPIRSRLRGVRLLAILGTTIVVSTGINVAISNAHTVSSQLGTGLTVLGYSVDLVINVGLFSVAFEVLTAIDLGIRDVIAGGLITGVLWQVLQTFGSRYVVNEVRHGSALYGVFGVVLATLAWIYLVALVMMLSAEINVVRQRRLWPRSVRSPFTDDMAPTRADLAAFESYAMEPRFKGWQHIVVGFDPPDPVPGGDGPAGPVTPPV